MRHNTSTELWQLHFYIGTHETSVRSHTQQHPDCASMDIFFLAMLASPPLATTPTIFFSLYDWYFFCFVARLPFYYNLFTFTSPVILWVVYLAPLQIIYEHLLSFMQQREKKGASIQLPQWCSILISLSWCCLDAI